MMELSIDRAVRIPGGNHQGENSTLAPSHYYASLALVCPRWSLGLALQDDCNKEKDAMGNYYTK